MLYYVIKLYIFSEKHIFNNNNKKKMYVSILYPMYYCIPWKDSRININYFVVCSHNNKY